MKILQIMCITWLMMSLPGESAAFRCGTSLITEGDVLYTVLKKCGEPDAEFAYVSPMLSGAIDLQSGENKTIIWTYDRSRGSGVIHRIRFQDGVVSKITSIRR